MIVLFRSKDSYFAKAAGGSRWKASANRKVAPDAKKERGRSQIRFAVFDLATSVAVAKAIQDKGGGGATEDQLAAFLGYSGKFNGAFANRVAAAKMFGLISVQGAYIRPTALAHTILSPTYEEDAHAALLEAFFNVPLFKAVFDEYHGKELPPEFGMKNALRLQFGVTPNRVDAAYRTLMNSADTAGLFSIRGSRTQLIIPTVGQFNRPADTPSTEQEPRGPEDNGGGPGGGAGDGSGPTNSLPRPRSREALQNEYISLLLDAFKEKLAKGEMDMELGDKIEKLVGLQA